MQIIIPVLFPEDFSITFAKESLQISVIYDILPVKEKCYFLKKSNFFFRKDLIVLQMFLFAKARFY